MDVLVAYDGSDGTEEALRFAVRLTEHGGSLTALHVINPLVGAADIVAPSRDAAVAILRTRLEDALRTRLATITPTPTGIVLEVDRGEDVAECIDRVANERHADIVVIASRRATGLYGLALGSVTQELLRISRRPVTVVRA